jgi:hypothetical protein
MGDWLATLAEPLYGIVDLFLDSPVRGALMTLLVGGLAIAAALSLR